MEPEEGGGRGEVKKGCWDDGRVGERGAGVMRRVMGDGVNSRKGGERWSAAEGEGVT